MFKHIPLDFPKLKRNDNTAFGRCYTTPEGDLPSITTALGRTGNKFGLHAWRKRVGAEEAQRVMMSGAARGTAMHQLCEDYLNNKEITLSENETGNRLFENIKPLLDNIDNIRAQEAPVYSKSIRAAGTVDCCADYKGITSVIDFKSSNKEKKTAWIQDYFLQGAFYVSSIMELTGVLCKQIVILIAPEEGELQEFIIPQEKIVSFINKAKVRVDTFTADKLISMGQI